MKVSIAFMLVALSSCFGTSSSLNIPNIERLEANEIYYWSRVIQMLTEKYDDAQKSEGADKDFKKQCTLQAILQLVSELAEKLGCTPEEILEGMDIPDMTFEGMKEMINGGMSVNELSGEECDDFLFGMLKGLVEMALGLIETLIGPVTGILEGLPFVGEIMKSLGGAGGGLFGGLPLVGGLLGGEGGGGLLGGLLGGEGGGGLLGGLLGGEGGLLAGLPIVGDLLGGDGGLLAGLPIVGDLLGGDGGLLAGLPIVGDLLGGDGGLLAGLPIVGDLLGGDGGLLAGLPIVGDLLGGDGGLLAGLPIVGDLLGGGVGEVLASQEEDSTVPQSEQPETEVVEGSEIIDKVSGPRQEDNIGGFAGSMDEDKSSSWPMGAGGVTGDAIESIVVDKGNFVDIFAVPDGMNQGMTGQTFGESNWGYGSWPAGGIESVGGNSGNGGENTGGMFADQDGETGQIVKEDYASITEGVVDWSIIGEVVEKTEYQDNKAVDTKYTGQTAEENKAAKQGKETIKRESEESDEQSESDEGSDYSGGTEESNVTKRRKSKGTLRGSKNKSQAIGYADKDRTGKGKTQGNGGSKGKASGGWGIAGKGAAVEWEKAGKGTAVEWGKAGKGTSGWRKAGKGAEGGWGLVGKGKNGAAGGVGKTSGGKESGNGFGSSYESFEYSIEEIATGDSGKYVGSGTSISDSGTSMSVKEATLPGGQSITGGKREMNQFTPTGVNDGGIEIFWEEMTEVIETSS